MPGLQSLTRHSGTPLSGKSEKKTGVACASDHTEISQPHGFAKKRKGLYKPNPTHYTTNKVTGWNRARPRGLAPDTGRVGTAPIPTRQPENARFVTSDPQRAERNGSLGRTEATGQTDSVGSRDGAR